jgi:lysophospholipase L1-like esterase
MTTMKSVQNRMTQIFILGSSSVYGVGAKNGGWADLIKRALHEKMYSENGIGEKIEIYNFGKSGATVNFVRDTFPQQLAMYGRGGKIITIVSIGGNNAKAIGSPDAYVSTFEEYSQEMAELLDLLKKLSSHVIAVGGGFFDESKTNPRINPFSGSKVYFTNERKQQFEAACQQLCEKKEIPFVKVSVTKEEWLRNYVFEDGLHPNQQGHQLICDAVLAVLSTYI